MNRTNCPLTLEQLYKEIGYEIKKGNGKKYVFISNDEEGNGFHECYFSVTNTKEYEDYWHIDIKAKDCVILG